MSSRSRKYECGNEKHKRKRRLEQFARTQKGALDRFVVKEFKQVHKIKLLRQIVMQIMMTTQTMLRLTLQKLIQFKLILTMLTVLM